MKTWLLRTVIFVALSPFLTPCVSAQSDNHGIARLWNEELLEAIRNDFARPVVHARNLYHTSAAMYDSWSLVTGQGLPAFLNQDTIAIELWNIPEFADPEAAAREAVSHAAYRMLRHRYANSPGKDTTLNRVNRLMAQLGYDIGNASRDYLSGDPAALGNFVAAEIISYTMGDRSNESGDYANLTYPEPANPPLQFTNAYSIFRLMDPNRWQSLQFPGVVIDQSGNPVGDGRPLPFLGAQWGDVTPFAMDEDDRARVNPEFQYGNSWVYHDPGPPPTFSPTDTAELGAYRWNFETVLKWSSHLDPNDGVFWDISPGARGNLNIPYPTTLEEYQDFFLKEGGTAGANGHPVNPVTGQPYEPNIVPRGDYTRILAEFWADGPASETPPGHWFDIWNGVMDHPLFERKLYGAGPELDPLEYEVKTYLALGGAMHDAAISAWSIKGAYDYIRPVSAIRWLATNGQCSDPNGANYSVFGMQLDPGYIQPLSLVVALQNPATLAQIRAYAWVGPDAIADPLTDVAGVGWINPSLWYPYQRPTFVTPNFAGYVSGHSTYSSAAAYVLERVTGSPYFPGGMGEFVAKRNEFLVFEEGPTQDVVLQWATYRDASDQTSLSRIWGGIHPPVDDIPGRKVGMLVGADAVDKADELFRGNFTSNRPVTAVDDLTVYPNPVAAGADIILDFGQRERTAVVQLLTLQGQEVSRSSLKGSIGHISTQRLAPGVYILRDAKGGFVKRIVVQ